MSPLLKFRLWLESQKPMSPTEAQEYINALKSIRAGVHATFDSIETPEQWERRVNAEMKARYAK